MKKKEYNHLLTRDEVLEIELNDDQWNKVKGYGEGGQKVKITWDGKKLYDLDEDLFDYGYCFQLPDHSQNEGDVFIHISNSFNLEGKDDADEVFIHLYQLLTNESIKEVEFYD